MTERMWCIQKCRLFEQLPAEDLSFPELFNSEQRNLPRLAVRSNSAAQNSV